MMWILLAVASSARTAADDQVALERMARGDQARPGGDVPDRHARLVYSLALRIVRDRGEAEDVDAGGVRPGVAPGESLRHHARQRGRLAVDDGSRTRRSTCFAGDASVRNSERDDVAVDTKDAAPGQDVQLEWGQRAEAIQEAMGALPLLQRLAIELAFFEGLTQAEIAEQLEVPLGTVKTTNPTGAAETARPPCRRWSHAMTAEQDPFRESSGGVRARRARRRGAARLRGAPARVRRMHRRSARAA